MTPEKEKPGQAKRSATVMQISRLVVGCLVLMWGVINVVHNFLNWRAGQAESDSWWLTVCFVMLTGVVPMAIGIWLLFRATPRPD